MNAINSAMRTRGPQSALEKKYILEYLNSQGYCPQDLADMPREDARRLMTEASFYASLRLAEVEAKAKFLQKIGPPK